MIRCKEVYDFVGLLKDGTRGYSISIGLYLAYQCQAVDEVLEDLSRIVFIPSGGRIAMTAPFQYIGATKCFEQHEGWVELPLQVCRQVDDFAGK